MTALDQLESVGAAIDHVALAVPDLDTASAPYLMLGLRAASDELVPGQGVRVRMLESAAGRIELLEPTGPDTPVGRFLAKRGPGLHHVGLQVESLDQVMGDLTRAGARFTDPQPRPGHGGTRVVFLHPSWTGGVLLELIEYPGAGS
jgi:methylmalonyl-CoA/ethylmalonyl-CoA epimerase